jgi:hypothetical protein
MDFLFGGGLFGLVVLGAAAARTLPARQAAIIGVTGMVVIAVGETIGPHRLFEGRVLHALGGATLWAAALAVAAWARYLDARTCAWSTFACPVPMASRSPGRSPGRASRIRCGS